MAHKEGALRTFRNAQALLLHFKHCLYDDGRTNGSKNESEGQTIEHGHTQDR